MISTMQKATRPAAPAGRAFHAFVGTLAVAAVLLMHGVASQFGCPDGAPAMAPVASQAVMAGMSLATEHSATSPLWTVIRTAGHAGEVCVSLPASGALAGVLSLLLAAATARRGTAQHAPALRGIPAWRGPPHNGAALLTRIGVCRN
jgi:hypothetical protein